MIISVDSVNFYGSVVRIQANGLPLAIGVSTKDTDVRHGGSGGFIFINTTQLINKNNIDTGVAIQANGGHGKSGGFGGSGGMVILNKATINQQNI